jgi:DNA-binding NtrC family response regulator
MPGLEFLLMLRMWKAINSHAAHLLGQSPAAPAAIPLVALIHKDDDRKVLTNIGARDRLDIHFAGTCADAWSAANRLKSPVVLCSRDLEGMEWRDTVRILAAAAPRPCVILASAVVDNYLWHEVVANGGYEVVATPLRDEDTTRVINLALAWWKSTSRVSHRSRNLARA